MKKAPVKLYWWRGDGGKSINIGDEINGQIMEYASGRAVEKTHLHLAEILAIGSLIHFPQKQGVLAARKTPYHIWGSGSLSAVPVQHREKLSLSAIRGPLSLSLFQGQKDVPFGDPGLLSSEVWVNNTSKKYKWGLAPHHSQLERPWVKRLLEDSENCVLIDVKDPDVAATMTKISDCEYIAATSLHGLILADAYRVPSVWLWDGALHSGGTWKFFDYFSGVGRHLSDSIACNGLKTLDTINLDNVHTDHFSRIEGLCKNLLRALPV